MDPRLEDKIDKLRRTLFPEGLDKDGCKSALGAALREEVIKYAPGCGGTVTTMLMEFDTEVILSCIADNNICYGWVQEALEIIDTHETSTSPRPLFPPIPPHPPHADPPAPPNGLSDTENMGDRDVKGPV